MLPKKKLKYLLVFKKWAFFGQKQPSYIRKLQKNTAVATVRSIDAFFATDLYIVAAWHSSIFQKPPHFLSCSKFFVQKKRNTDSIPFQVQKIWRKTENTWTSPSFKLCYRIPQIFHIQSGFLVRKAHG